MKKQKINTQSKKKNFTRGEQDKKTQLESYIRLYDDYLKMQRGLLDSSRQRLCRIGQLFLLNTFKSKVLHLSQIKKNDIIKFMDLYAQQKSPRHIQFIAYSLRSFLRFLKFKGLVALDFSAVVPTVAVWGKDRIPEFLTEAEVKKLLKSCDKRTSTGLRDFTILCLILGLGLRACEVSSLTLEDFDWHNGVVVIHGKGHKVSYLPLSQDLGDALGAYIQKGRPICSSRRFFVSQNRPFHGLGSKTISIIVGKALKRAGIQKKGKAHLLRHTLATLLLNKGASLQEIGEVLRHQSINTTTIYAKVDFKRLRPLALPWPGNLNFGGLL